MPIIQNSSRVTGCGEMNNQCLRFFGRVVVVTGGGSGIGRQIAQELYSEGAMVHILGRNNEKLVQAKRKIECEIEKQEASGIFCHQCDVSDAGRVVDVFQLIKEDCGNVTVLVNSAAINPS